MKRILRLTASRRRARPSATVCVVARTMRAGIRRVRLRLAVKQHRNLAESSVSSNANRLTLGCNDSVREWPRAVPFGCPPGGRRRRHEQTAEFRDTYRWRSGIKSTNGCLGNKFPIRGGRAAAFHPPSGRASATMLALPSPRCARPSLREGEMFMETAVTGTSHRNFVAAFARTPAGRLRTSAPCRTGQQP